MRHTLDVMHIERNVATTAVGFLLGDLDTVAVRKDVQQEGVMPHLHLLPDEDGATFIKPHAPYVLRKEERTRLLRNIRSVRTPQGHCANFEKLVNVEKETFQFMKTHDWHVLLQEVLPASIRGLLPEGVEVAIIRLGHCFKRICSKVIDVRELPALQTYVAETMALLEIHFPLAFWNVMPHLVLHLPRELYWCGPVHARWMYCAERYIGHLKSLVRNKARPEGSIAMGYIMEEALGFVTEHFRLYPVRARVIWEMDDDERQTGEVLEGKGIKRRWTEGELEELHEHIIRHSIITEGFYRYFI